MNELDYSLRKLRTKNYENLDDLKKQEEINKLILNILFMVGDEISEIKKEIKSAKDKKSLKTRVVDLENKFKTLEKKK